MAIDFLEEEQKSPALDFQDEEIAQPEPRRSFGELEPFDTSPFSGGMLPGTLNLPPEGRMAYEQPVDLNRIPDVRVSQPRQAPTPPYEVTEPLEMFKPVPMPVTASPFGTVLPVETQAPEVDLSKPLDFKPAPEETGIVQKLAEGEPLLPVGETLEVHPDDPKTVAIGKEVSNLLKGLIEFPQTLEGGAALATGAAFPKFIAGLFTASTFKSLGEQVYHNYKSWDTMTGAEKAAAITSMAGTGAFATILGKSTLAKTGLPRATRDLKSLAERPTNPIEQAPSPRGFEAAPERTPNASTITSTEGLPQPEVWTPVGEEARVRQSGQTAGTQVKTEVSPPPAEQVRAEVTPDIVQFGQDFAAGKKISTEAAVGVGLKAKSIADLEALMEIQAKFKEEVAQARQRVKSATTPAEQQAALQEAVIKGTSAQLPREAIEGAVNAGSNAERGNIKFGERPLDWRKNPEVAEWLKKNGEKIGIKLPDELKSETPTTQAAATPEGGNLVAENSLGESVNIPKNISSDILSKTTPQEMSDSLAKHESEIAKLCGKLEGFMSCDLAAGILSQALKKKGIPHKVVYGNVKGQSHSWIKVGEQNLDPTKQGISKRFTVSEDYPGSESFRAELQSEGAPGRPNESLPRAGSSITKPPPAPAAAPVSPEVKSDWQETNRGRDVYKADVGIENAKDESVVEAMKSAPSYPKLLAAYNSLKRSLYGKNYDPKAIDKKPWEMLDSSSGVMSAKSQRAKTLSALESAVFKESGLPRKKPSSRFRGGTGVDWESVKPTPPPAGEMKGMGGAKLGETSNEPQLRQLTDSLRSLAEVGKKPELRRAYTLSEKASQWKDSASKSLDALKGVAYYAKEKLRGMPKWDSFKNALGQRQLALTESTLNNRDYLDKARRAVPKALDREAINDWIDTGGNPETLNEALLTTKEPYKKGYEKALNLTPDQLIVAKNEQNYFESRLEEAQELGIVEHGLENYIHRIYEKDSPWKQGVLAELRSGVFTGKPALAKKRLFQYDFEAEAAGYKPVKDFAIRTAAYDASLNKAIADRQFVKEAMQWKMPDGRPAIDAAGVGIPIEGAEGDAGPLLIKPQFRPKDTTDPKNNRSDYVALDHPALRKWKWVGEGAEGNPVLIQGNVLVHPDALGQIKAVFGKSKVRQNIVGRAALGLGSTVKQTMLDLSGFHPVQITVHGWEHRTFKPIKEIDLQDPVQRDLVSHGLVAADPRGLELFGEGLVGSSLTRHIPGLGPKLQAYNEWLFQDYIPRLKMAMALHALERNKARFKSDLESGKMTEDQLLHLTANQGNAAFGELNYEMMGRNKTTQDMLRLALLAPDFLEARSRFAGQAFTKYGKEQRQALLLGAATLYITARIVNKMLDDQYHFEPKNAFSIVHNGHAYSLRTVQGDLLHAVTDPAKFAYNRLSPVYGRTGLEAVTGRDAFGRKRSAIEQIQDLAKTIVPISLRGVVNPQEQKLWESFLNSIGVTERRETAADDIFKLAQDFKKKVGVREPGEFIYDPEKDPYRSIKVAVAYGTPQEAAQEMILKVRSGELEKDKLEAYVKRFATMPFTGSKKNDQLFYDQLSDDQKKTYALAIKERQQMKQKMNQAFILLKNNP